MADARYRGPSGNSARAPEPSKPIKEVADATAKDAASFSVLDVLRVLAGIIILVSGVSYLSTSGESMTWGYNAWWTRAREWKGLLVRPSSATPNLISSRQMLTVTRALQNPAVHLTDTQLLAYDGTDPKKPIYLALNGTIYDVSSSPATYGPGGSYHFFAGHDAARAFLTGCFQEDATPDLRGVEQMFIPIDPWEKTIHSSVSAEERAQKEEEAKTARKKRESMTKGELKNLYAKELRMARSSVREGLEGWHKLFRGEKGKPYRKVGEVVREEGWLGKLPKRELCDQAVKQRPTRKYE